MFVKLVLLACSLAVATAVWNGPLAGGQPAHLYPAGVSPQACPNFPNCNNPAVAADPQAPASQWGAQPQWNAQPQPQWNAQPQSQWNQQNNWNSQPNQWNQGQYNPAPVPQQWGNDATSRLNKGEYIGDGDYHGEGLVEALAPGYENQNLISQWNNPNQGAPNQWNNGIPHNAQQAHGVGQIPAGVDAHSCPNYPFCS
ncbi:bifunctional endo-1,4-beta-xylanase XylA-like [Diorhabda carinulata]|uniref:bifunctional endo-1,4-beta-xylanase XylA-like n=1 Tax=Diorhabda sublineata TaxID=1163346 RepID=UPI0024E0CEED|nr:bifunctional endo-1,4-beta-xylanase XylA-like [Diorhabda sublineata]XP_056647380.1 bifunctional endo-1,4-beta-xylanase XylA-like [Diorhabda sublineata]XP_057663858.1 bifunctional endo-1,4-beta-xylanase XylA-like [Diorhabda carinulata]